MRSGNITAPSFITLHASSKARTIIFNKTVRYNLMKVLCKHENQKQQLFIVNYYFYFLNETI